MSCSEIILFHVFLHTGFVDYIPVTDSDPQEFLTSTNRRSCFDVIINPDNTYEGTEQFSLSLQFDSFLVDEALRSQVTIEPSVAYVDIIDQTGKWVWPVVTVTSHSIHFRTLCTLVFMYVI